MPGIGLSAENIAVTKQARPVTPLGVQIKVKIDIKEREGSGHPFRAGALGFGPSRDRLRLVFLALGSCEFLWLRVWVSVTCL